MHIVKKLKQRQCITKNCACCIKNKFAATLIIDKSIHSEYNEGAIDYGIKRKGGSVYDIAIFDESC